MERARYGTARLGVLLVVAGTAACTSPTDALNTPPEVARAHALEARFQDGIHLLVQVEDLDAYPAALYEGTVVGDDEGCVRLGGERGSTVIWPKGFTADLSGDRVVLKDRNGATVGSLGDAFRLGGGHVPTLHEGLGFTQADRDLAASRCPGDFWVVSPGSAERMENVR